MRGNKISTGSDWIGQKAKLYIFVGRLANLHTVELGTSRLKGDGTNRNPLNAEPAKQACFRGMPYNPQIGLRHYLKLI